VRLAALALIALGAGLWTAPAHAAAWCGTVSATNRVPNAVAGNPIHVVYAIPSDGADRSAQLAPAIESDVEAIDAWWRGQDPSRTPRFDLTQFGCGAQVDLSLVRLAQTGAQLASTSSRFEQLIRALVGNRFGSRAEKYLVYYDGPVEDADVCGTGGGDPGGLGYAFVFVNACFPFVPTVAVAAHELLHTMGAVPDEAPHTCPPPDDGHTCDNDRDLMYPYSDGSSLASLLLDPGRDDYYGHPGSWLDVQDSPWLVQIDRQTPLALSITGHGAVEADLPGLDCTETCATSWNAGTQLALVPTPAQDARFVGWSGACSGAGLCSLRLDREATVSAVFAAAELRLSVVVMGAGVVRSTPAGIACGAVCSGSFATGGAVTLRATARKGWRFTGWGGACAGRAATCPVRARSGRAVVRATFSRP
jgi:Divergent InlB B-repeat domain